MRRSSEKVRLALVSAAVVGVTGAGLYSYISALPDDDETRQTDGSPSGSPGTTGAGSTGYHGGGFWGFRPGLGGGSRAGSGGTSTGHSTPTVRGGFGSHGSSAGS